MKNLLIVLLSLTLFSCSKETITKNSSEYELSVWSSQSTEITLVYDLPIGKDSIKFNHYEFKRTWNQSSPRKLYVKATSSNRPNSSAFILIKKDGNVIASKSTVMMGETIIVEGIY